MMGGTAICAGCRLILDLYNTHFEQSAVGLIMANGYTATHSQHYKENSLFLTRDGGSNWYEVIKGNYASLFLMNGSVVLIYQEHE